MIGPASVSLDVGGVNVRKGPTVGSKRLDAIEPGHKVKVIREKDGWLKIEYRQAGEDCVGWSVRSAFVFDEPETPPLPDVESVPPAPPEVVASRGFYLLVGFGILIVAVFLTKLFLHIS